MNRPALALSSSTVTLLVLATLLPFIEGQSCTPKCGGKSVTVWGTAEADFISGLSNYDVVSASGGNDVIFVGDALVVTVCAGLGDDIVFLGADNGIVTAYGDSGNDVFFPGSGAAKTVHGGTGNDYVVGSEVAGLSVYGDDGDDWLEGTPEDDTISGGAGNDVIIGRTGADTLEEGTGNDLVLRGYLDKSGTNCPYGFPLCNKAVGDNNDTIADVWYRMRGDDDHRREFYGPRTDGAGVPLPQNNVGLPEDLGFSHHLQGIQRLPGVGDENWVVVSRSAEELGDGALYFVKFEGITTSLGHAWQLAPGSTATNHYYYYRIPGSDHAGGMQLQGHTLAVANAYDGHRVGFVSFHNVGDPANVFEIQRLNIGEQGELDADPAVELSPELTAVSLAQLEGGGFVLFATGPGNGEYGWFYATSDVIINENTEWRYIDYWHQRDLEGTWGGVAHWATLKPENHNFITEKATGDIYMFAMGNCNNEQRVYTVSLQGMEFKLEHALDQNGVPLVRGIDTSAGGGNLCSSFNNPQSLRWGSGVHVTPNGNVATYVHARKALDIDEFRPSIP